MKILVLSLLRLGDIIQHAELIPAMRKAYPEADIHFLVNQSFMQAQQVLPEIKNWHCLDRKFIEQVLVEQAQSPRAAFDHLQDLVNQLNGLKFDLIMNLTHNMFSVRLMDLLAAPDKRGAAFVDGKKIAFSNPWLNYFNDHYAETGGSRFHYLEILHRSMDLPFLPPRRQRARKSGPIYLQVLTADEKKNWGLGNFLKLKNDLQIQYPNQKIYAICSPSEKSLVSKFFSDEEIVSPSLAEAVDLFKEGRLLITGDTSIQHLAVRSGIPILSLFLGSADPIKTSPWLVNPTIISSSAGCSPCRASQKCSQASHICAQSISVNQVLATALQMLAGQLEVTKHIGTEQVVWRTYLDQVKLSDSVKSEKNSVDIHIDRLSLKIEEISKVIFGQISQQQAQQMAQEIKSEINLFKDNFPEMSDSVLSLDRSYEFLDRSFFEFLKMLRAGIKEMYALQQIRKSMAAQSLNSALSPEVPRE